MRLSCDGSPGAVTTFGVTRLRINGAFLIKGGPFSICDPVSLSAR